MDCTALYKHECHTIEGHSPGERASCVNNNLIKHGPDQ